MMLLICSLVSLGVGGLSSVLFYLANSFFMRSSYSAKIAAKALDSFFSGYGKGGFGDVYKVKFKDKYYALKI